MAPTIDALRSNPSFRAMVKAWPAERRDQLKAGHLKGAFAGPGETFPIAGPEDVAHAWDLAGHAADPEEVRRHVIRIATEHGWEHALPQTARDLMKAHVKSHYRFVNGKAVYVHEHDKQGAPVGTEASLQQRTAVAKHVKTGAVHLRAFDADDRDAILEHAKKLGINATVKRQAGHLHYHEGGKGDHAFYQIHAGSDEEAMKLHHALGTNKKIEADKASDAAAEASDKASDASTMLDGPKADPSKHHLAAHDAHTQAGEMAPTAELKQLHQEKAKHHGDMVGIHKAGMKMAQAHAEYHHAAEKAHNASQATPDEPGYEPHDNASYHAEAAEKHGAAALAHATASTAASFGKLGDKKKEHDELSMDHQAQANYHKAALDAVYSSNAAAKKDDTGTLDEQALAHAQAAAAHQEAAQHAEKLGGPMQHAHAHHADKAKQHQELSDNLTAKAKQAAAAPAHPWKGKDHEAIAQQGHAAAGAGDHGTAAQHFKHAAVVAHHNGETEKAQQLAALAKEHAAKGTPMQKAVDLKVHRTQVYEAVRAVLCESTERRHLTKALADLPSVGRLRDACLKATAAGITDVHKLITIAAGGGERAKPLFDLLNGQGR